MLQKIPYYIAAFLFGLGYIKPSISYLILFTLFFYVSRNAHNIIKNKLGAVVGILWVLFFLSYYYFFIPPDLPWGKIPLEFYRYFQVAVPIILIYHLVLLLPDKKDASYMIIFISLGMMAFAVANTGYTLVLLEPPYYGKAYHSIHKFVYNSPGTTILGSMLPIVLISFWDNKFNKFSFINLLLPISIVSCIVISIVFTARTPLFILLLSLILKVILDVSIASLNKKTIYRVIIFIIGITLVIGLAFILLPDFSNFLYYRILNSEYSVKIQHHLDYWDQVKGNFWIYPNANYVVRYDWFHNFFFDNHRTSGPITAIISYLIFFLAFIKAFYDFYTKKEYSKEIFILFILFIPFLITTIPWESSESQMIGLYAGIVGLVFRKK